MIVEEKRYAELLRERYMCSCVDEKRYLFSRKGPIFIDRVAESLLQEEFSRQGLREAVAKFVANGYPFAGVEASFLDFDAALEGSPNSFDAPPPLVVDSPPVDSNPLVAPLVEILKEKAQNSEPELEPAIVNAPREAVN
ncbi:hypothetical protein Salat_1664800 [Sesamum alatum]|uniref:Uncharacterized protein n=1 Tax=Sesamum alatum TaxID=300844 RepID=A0AAE2CJQ9_9LAMI|nr:hypothetical protein Salat_1664800 [Sesamum alatum]